MLFFSLFLAGFMLGVFATLKIFSPESREEPWDPQQLPKQSVGTLQSEVTGLQKQSENVSLLFKDKTKMTQQLISTNTV